MSDILDGKYLIVPAGPAASPPFPVGTDVEGGPVIPVVVGGKHHVWTVCKLANGNYTLVLEHGHSQDYQNNVVVVIMPPAGEWTIRSWANDSYSIDVPSDIRPTRAWTVENTNPGTKVTLAILELPRPGQLWNFIPLPKD